MAKRIVVFDTETTGIAASEGDRIVEIGCVEMLGLDRTSREFHAYLDPERDVPDEVVRVHGLTRSFLRGKPKFAEIADALMAFFGEDPIVAHNAEFDREFLNAELFRLGRPPVPRERFIDTVPLARKKWPGQRASLDALANRCELQRLGFDLSARKGAGGHGALLDAKMLAEIYVQISGGREQALSFGDGATATEQDRPIVRGERRRPRPSPLPLLSTNEERAAHAEFLAGLGATPLWTTLAGDAG